MAKEMCDFCGREYLTYDLERMLTYKGKTKWICYRCRSLGNSELKKLTAEGMARKKLIGDK